MSQLAGSAGAVPASKSETLSLGTVWNIIRQTFTEWMEDKAPQLGAALSFYCILSLAPLLIIVLAIAGAFFGDDAARGELVSQIRGMVGREGAEAIQEILANANKPFAGIWATVVGGITLLLGASGVFGQLQDSLNTIWDVKPKANGIVGVIKDRFLSFAMVLGTGFLLLISLVVSAGLTALGNYMSGLLPGIDTLWGILNFLIALGVITVLFALIFRLIPDTEIAWNEVWIGAFITSLLFSFGKFALGMYLGSQSVGSSYGAAGSLVVLVVWVYYSAQILFFGAEFTQVYSRWKRTGSTAKPPVSNTNKTEMFVHESH